MFRKGLLVLLLIFIPILIHTQNTTSQYEIKLRSKTTGQLIPGKDVDLYQNGVKKYDLVEESPGIYRNSAVATGEYDVYVDGKPLPGYQGIWIGSNKLTLVQDAFTNYGELMGDKIQDSTIALRKFTKAAYDFIGSGGNVTNNPDDITTRTNASNQIYVDTTLIPTHYGYVAADTNALKTMSVPTFVYLKGLSSTNRNGGGWFVEVDSIYPEDGVIAFAHPINGKQWKRKEFDGSSVRSSWLGDRNLTYAETIANSLGQKINLIIDDVRNMTSDLTISDAVNVFIKEGGRINQNGHLLQIKGTLSAGRYQIFDQTRNIEAYVRDFWYPEWFGAKADGDLTDDTRAINLTIYSAQQSGGGIVSFQARRGGAKGTGDGHYLVSEYTPGCGYAIVAYTNVHLVGAASEAYAGSRIRFKDNDNTNDVTVIVNNGWVMADTTDPNFRTGLEYTGSANPGWWHFASIRDLVIDCNGDSNSYNVNGIDIFRFGENSVIENVTVARYKGFGIRVNDAAPCYIQRTSVWPAEGANKITDVKLLGDWTNNQRIGLFLYGAGIKSVRGISGDNSNPLVLVKKGGFNYISSIKAEFPDSLTGFSTVSIDSVHFQASVFINSMFSNAGVLSSPNKYGVVLTGSSSDKPLVIANNINLTGGYKYLMYDFVEVDSIVHTDLANAGFIISNASGRFNYRNAIRIRNNKYIQYYDKYGDLFNLLTLASNNYVYFRFPTELQIISDVGSLLLQIYEQGVRVGSSSAGKSLEVFGRTYVKGGLVVSGASSSGFPVIDSVKVLGSVPNDSLIFFIGGRAYYVMPK